MTTKIKGSVLDATSINYYLGTSSINFGRSSDTQLISGLNIDGNANSALYSTYATSATLVTGNIANSVVAVTQTFGDNSNSVATTAFVNTAIVAATGALGTMSKQSAGNVNITGGVINNITFSNTTTSLANITNGKFTTLGEVTTITSTPAGGTINFDLLTQSVLYSTGSATSNWTVNFRGTGSIFANTLMAIGETRTVSYMTTQGATAYYNNAITIDGNAVTPKWQGGVAPTAGDTNSIDLYTYSIIKTGSAAFTVLASWSQFV